MWRMWGSRERAESMIAPKLRAWGEREAMVLMIMSVGELVSLLRVDLEPMGNSGFIAVEFEEVRVVMVRVTHLSLFAVEGLHCNELKTPCVE